MWSWLADKLILSPSRHAIDCDGEQRWVSWEGGEFEAWIQRTGEGDAQMVVLKFPGTAGRAERSTIHPADGWEDVPTEVWTVNPPGYGASPGRASLSHRQAITEATWQAVQRAADGRPVVVTGNSLGSLSAMYLAAHHPVDGLLLRNPVPLRKLIRTRYGRMASLLVARHVPEPLCPIQNAARASAPAVFVSSQKDRVVPAALQQEVFENYGGDSHVLELAEADHADLPSEEESAEYVRLLRWLRDRVTQRG